MTGEAGQSGGKGVKEKFSRYNNEEFIASEYLVTTVIITCTPCTVDALCNFDAFSWQPLNAW